MSSYAITEKAGRFVAGQVNNGVGTVLELTEKQAEHEVRLGTLEDVGKANKKRAKVAADKAAVDAAAAKK